MAIQLLMTQFPVLQVACSHSMIEPGLKSQSLTGEDDDEDILKLWIMQAADNELQFKNPL